MGGGRTHFFDSSLTYSGRVGAGKHGYKSYAESRHVVRNSGSTVWTHSYLGLIPTIQGVHNSQHLLHGMKK